MNNNFDYLDGRITDVGSSITTLQSNIQTLNTTLGNMINDLGDNTASLSGNNTLSGDNTFSGSNTVSGSTTHNGAFNCSGDATYTGTIKVPASSTVGTALQLAAQSKSSNGYIKLGNGLIIQWGHTSVNQGTYTTTFPTAFSSVYTVVASRYDTQDVSYYDVLIRSITTTKFTTYQSQSNANSMYWIAIGV